MFEKLIIKPILCNCCNIVLPYIIKTENPTTQIGIFGDSFAGIQDESIYTEVHDDDEFWTHEFSWMYYLGMLTNSEIHSWGLSAGSEKETAFLLATCPIKYDLYIIVHTQPHRSNVRINLPKKLSVLASLVTMKEYLKNKKTIHMYWNKKHKIYKFKNSIEYCFEDIVNNHGYFKDDFLPSSISKIPVINKFLDSILLEKRKAHPQQSEFDKLSGMNHLSNRGNLLLGMEINKLLT